MARYQIELPLPPKALSTNGNKGSWRRKHNAVKAYRAACATLLRAGVGRRLSTPVTWHQDYYASRADSALGLYHPKDEENAISALKAARDALADAGLIASDSRKHLRLGQCRLFSTARECKGPGRVVVTLEEVEW